MKPLISKKKKKGGQHDQVNTDIVAPLKQWTKDLQTFFNNQLHLEIANFDQRRKEELKVEYSKVEEVPERVANLIKGKVEEIQKEEKAGRERLRELSIQVGKKIKNYFNFWDIIFNKI